MPSYIPSLVFPSTRFKTPPATLPTLLHNCTSALFTPLSSVILALIVTFSPSFTGLGFIDKIVILGPSVSFKETPHLEQTPLTKLCPLAEPSISPQILQVLGLLHVAEEKS